jgi:hypothetical protein
MTDTKYLYDKQVSEFLFNFNNRFKQIYHTNMPGKVAYQANLNRSDLNAVIKM